MNTRTVYHRFRCYVGPVHVAHYTECARRNGVTDAWAGTEHVYGTWPSDPFTTETDRLVYQQRVAHLVYDTPMATGWRDVQILSERFR
jgi:hypothetical protein